MKENANRGENIMKRWWQNFRNGPYYYARVGSLFMVVAYFLILMNKYGYHPIGEAEIFVELLLIGASSFCFLAWIVTRWRSRSTATEQPASADARPPRSPDN